MPGSTPAAGDGVSDTNLRNNLSVIHVYRVGVVFLQNKHGKIVIMAVTLSVK